MLKFLIQMKSTNGIEQSFTFSKEDIALLGSSPMGRPIRLENYVCYRSSDGKIAMARGPSFVEQVIICYSELCRRLAEAQIEDAEGASE